ncbi:hypothetical protein BG910_07090 [Neisseria chenwenguii]|uniref:Uncharacterized protein n=1 Tax=Neisseria chenwenguii TaxID=1853278 RepID=A0A220S228_9NEIS|nr:PIG-L family deacetylase [Neisseria chenwenguii]ASK27539.1 hypothetical protein BG910_07090 [Neisseria chenwenguii]
MFNKKIKETNNIYAFWESKNGLPAYLDLCKQTWEKHIPNAKIHILNYQNLESYIGDIYDIEKLKTIPLAMQSDIISAAVLEKFGGLFLDIDCIATGDVFAIFDKIAQDKLVAFGRPNDFAIHLAVLYCKKPGNPILREWRKEAQDRLNNKPEKFGWAYFGNEIINPLLKSNRYRDDFYIIDRSVSGNILESCAIMDTDPSRAIADYKNFWFNECLGFSPAALELVTCRIISLHNSWTPEKYRNIRNIKEFLSNNIPIARLLEYVLSNKKTVSDSINYPILEGYLVSELNNKNIAVSRKYFRNMLVLDFNTAGRGFAFDITVSNGNTVSLDLVLRNFSSSEIETLPFFKNFAFEHNKARIAVCHNHADVLKRILECCDAFSITRPANTTQTALLTNAEHILADDTHINDVYIDLENIEIKNNKLFLSGIAFIKNVNVADWSDIDYKLIFKSKEKEYTKQLAKLHKTEITEQFSDGTCRYDKCYFTTFNQEGLDLTDIAFDNYELFLSLSAGGLTNQQKLRTTNHNLLRQPAFSGDIKGKWLYLDMLIINADIASTLVVHDKTKQPIVESFTDTAGNRLTVPKNSNNCFVRFEGRDNIVEIDPEANIHNLYIEMMGNGGTVKIGKQVSLHGTIRIGFGCEVRIGDRTSSTNPIYATCAEQTRLIIGSDCMFATNNQLRTDDAHAIYDVHTGKRTNKSKDIIIGDHVWIGYGATISGGTVIGSGSVVGAFSFVRNKFPNNCVIAGVPAKLVKKDIFWERPLLLNAQDEISFSGEELAQKSHCQPTQEIVNDAQKHAAPPTVSKNLDVFIHAHPDDIELFMSVAATQAINNGNNVVMLLMTSGDGGAKNRFLDAKNGSKVSYPEGRLKAHDAAIQYWLGGNSMQTKGRKTVGNHKIDFVHFDTKVASYNLMLPDGYKGIGFDANNYETLARLYEGNINEINSLDGNCYRGTSDLENTIVTLLQHYVNQNRNIVFHIPEFNAEQNKNSHSDHYLTGEIMRRIIAANHFGNVEVKLYADYENGGKPVNLSPEVEKEHRKVNSLVDDVLIANGRDEQVRKIHLPFLGKEYVTRSFTTQSLAELTEQILPTENGYPALERFLISALKARNIVHSKKYFRNMLIVDFNANGTAFSFDLTQAADNTVSVDLVLRNRASTEFDEHPLFKQFTFINNKARIAEKCSKEETLDWMARCLDGFLTVN